MIEVFKTNIAEDAEFKAVARAIRLSFPAARVSFDPDDRDRIVRVECPLLQAGEVIAIIHDRGFTCEILSDSINE